MAYLGEDEFLDNIDSPSLRCMLERAFSVRHETLDRCYSIRDYGFLPDHVKDDIYDAFKSDVEQIVSLYAEIEALRKALNRKED